MALFDKHRAMALKRVLAVEFEDMEGALAVFEGPTGSTLINQRNQKALAGLREQLKGGQRKIAIFYGGAHMPDMQKHLGEDFHLRKTSVRWIPAWNLKE